MTNSTKDVVVHIGGPLIHQRFDRRNGMILKISADAWQINQRADADLFSWSAGPIPASMRLRRVKRARAQNDLMVGPACLIAPLCWNSNPIARFPSNTNLLRVRAEGQ
ncbi:MAG: hypothetical protein CM15mP74_22530 [Halieaceae bacterium]|nr:MAG: hypothetical protein CM15mP74_22530 [Halieaceae bacterium]